MCRFELQLAQCIQTFNRFPDTPTMAIRVKLIEPGGVNPVSIERTTFVPDDLNWNGTLTVAQVDAEWAVDISADDPTLNALEAILSTPTIVRVNNGDTDTGIRLQFIELVERRGAWDYDNLPLCPPERRRLWVASATQSAGEKLLLPVCKRLGAVYGFYWSGMGVRASRESDLVGRLAQAACGKGGMAGSAPGEKFMASRCNVAAGLATSISSNASGACIDPPSATGTPLRFAGNLFATKARCVFLCFLNAQN